MNCNYGKNRKKNSGGDMKYLQTPCTIAEAVQIARGVAEDVLYERDSNSRHVQVAMSLQVEILKDIVIKAGLITEEAFRDLYMEKASEFEKMQRDYMESMNSVDDSEEAPSDPKMDVGVSDIEVTKLD